MMVHGRAAMLSPEQNVELLQKMRDEGYNVPPAMIDDARHRASTTTYRGKMAQMLYVLAVVSFGAGIVVFLFSGGFRVIKNRVVGIRHMGHGPLLIFLSLALLCNLCVGCDRSEEPRRGATASTLPGATGPVGASINGVAARTAMQETRAQQAIELAIAICLSDAPTVRLSPALRQKVDVSKLQSGFFLASDSPLHVTPDGVRWMLPADRWLAVPRNFTTDSKLVDADRRIRPEATVNMRGGEIGISNGEVFVSESTEAQVEKQMYVFRSGKWKIHH